MAKHARQTDYRDSYAHLGVEPSSGAGTPVERTVRQPSVRQVVPAAGSTPVQPGQNPPAKRRFHIAPVALLVGALALVYVAGILVFSAVFYPHTTLDGTDVSLKVEGEVARAHSESTSSAKLSVALGDDFAAEITGASIDLALDGAAYAHSAISTQTPWLWPVQALQTHELSFPEKASFDAEKLHAVVEKLVTDHNAHAQAPSDATASYDGTTGSYRLVPASRGNTLDAAKVEAEVSDALIEQRRSVELSDECYVQPTVLDDDPALKTAIDEVNDVLSATQTLMVEGVQVGKVSSQQIGSWVTVAADLSISVDADAIKKWTQGDLSRDLDTAGTRRTYTLPSGSSVSVTGGTYGWIIDGAALAEEIAENIKAGNSASIEVPMRQTADHHAQAGEADWGTRWVDVNLTTQHAQLIDGGQIVWESDVVTGCVSEGFETPTGVNAINGNMTSAEAQGEQVKLVSPFKDENGKPTYVSYVDWWMPFIENQYAFHDAPWRSQFGGSIYRNDGSHGCINLPADKAKELYRLLHVGDVVVVHN